MSPHLLLSLSHWTPEELDETNLESLPIPLRDIGGQDQALDGRRSQTSTQEGTREQELASRQADLEVVSSPSTHQPQFPHLNKEDMAPLV